MNLDCERVSTSTQQRWIDGNGLTIGFIAYVGDGIVSIWDIAIWHIVAVEFFSIEIDDTAIVDIEGKLYILLGCGHFGKVELMTEIVGCTLLLCIGSIVNRGLEVHSPTRSTDGTIT